MSEPEKPTQFMVDMPNLEIALDATDIARLARSQIIDLITEVDDEVGDWVLTLILHHRFAREAEAALVAVPELASKSEDELWQLVSDEEAAEIDGEAPIAEEGL